MDSDCQMFLVVNDDRHRLKQGITLLGSADNDRYSVIRLDEKSVCAKHAAVRCNPATQELHIMDLCSHSGITLARSPSASSFQELAPLEWHAVPNGARITIGSVIQCRAEIGTLLGGGSGGARRSSRLGSASFFEDSADFIDCSLEEPSSLKSRSNLQQTGTLNALTVSNDAKAVETSLQRDSFVVPATQPQRGASTSIQVNESQNVNVIGAGPEDDLDDDDLFYIPETQECNEEASADASQVIDPIGNTIGTGDKEDDFLCFESQDERNTGDGLFNNPYVELASQNLLQNLDESYKQPERKSIAPDRSVDSISFHGKLPEQSKADETDEDLSKLEWNETKNTTKGTDPREGSVTPELEFNKPSEEPRVESVTPDLDFDRITPQQEPLKLASTSKLSLSKKVEEPQDRTESVTPDLDFGKRKEVEKEDDEEEAGILPNQEAFNRSECQLDPYELATQAMVPDGEGEKEEDDPYLLATQALPVDRETHSTSVYDLATQAEPSTSKANLSSAFKVPAAPAPQVNDEDDDDDVYDLATQQLPPQKLTTARSLRKVNVKLTNWATSRSQNTSLRANKEFELDAFDVATQALPVDDAYDLATQALPQGGREGDDDDADVENDTIPLALPEDAYEMQTQALVAKDSRGSLVDEDDPEVTRNFRPAVNSTCRPSMIGRQMEEEDKEEELNISPSSNKENRTEVNEGGGRGKVGLRTTKRLASTQDDLLGFTEPTETEDLDDEYCLAATMPMADEEKERSRKSVFKVPENRSAASSTKSSRTGASSSSSTNSAMETPSRSKPDTDTCSFEFNTPEHPFLNMAKKETILAVSDMIKSQQPKALDRLARKNKYIFGDSSDEDQDPNEPVFKKQDSKLSVMKYDRDEPKVEQPAAAAAAERRSARDKKKSKRFSEDGEDDTSSSKASTSSSKSKASTSSRPKKQVDESVDYEPSVTVSESTTRSRKRKAAEEAPSAPAAQPKPSKSSKTTVVAEVAPEPAKTRGRPKRTVADLPPPQPKVEPKQERSSKRTKQKQPPEEDDGESASEANTSTGSAESSSSGTRKSSRVAKPRLMFTKMSPEPYKRMITRAAARKGQQR
ncbi:mediator of DNA damage checkpoint protein 1 isoform X3 [Culex quinquefasciatus]|uniref:mediator of DNA damage checkpoint protein 1 isoform X3 n=1 Tax=Culex quinquefasciatus TaxID=7176 RepID=UPI0018E2A53D|nr:mediator of DNA damage checkpoint protein 1 isoform X3 [Culex quinquefasciatus]